MQPIRTLTDGLDDGDPPISGAGFAHPAFTVASSFLSVTAEERCRHRSVVQTRRGLVATLSRR